MRMTCFVLAALLTAGAGAAGGQEKKKNAVVKVLLPEDNFKEPIVRIDGKEMKTTGSVRTFETPPLEDGKTYTYTIEAVIEPNNYTRITRPRDITFKAGDEITVDLRKEDNKLDKIVVRWVPTPEDIVDKMCELGKVTKDDVIFDPGCGDAVMLIRPVKKIGAKKGVGIDIDPKMVKQAQEKAKAEGVAEKVVIKQGDILNEKDMADAAEATVVLVYIGDDLGARMSPVLQKLLKPGARVVSHRFKLGDWKPDKTVTVKGEDGDEYTLHLWTVPEKKKEDKK